MEGDPNGRILRLGVPAGIILNMPGRPTNQPPSLSVLLPSKKGCGISGR